MAYGQPYRPEPEDDGMGMGTALGLGGLAAGAAVLHPGASRLMGKAGRSLRSGMQDASAWAGRQGWDGAAGAIDGAVGMGNRAAQGARGARDAVHGAFRDPTAAAGAMSQGAVEAFRGAQSGAASLRSALGDVGKAAKTPVRAEYDTRFFERVAKKQASGGKLSLEEQAASSLAQKGLLDTVPKGAEAATKSRELTKIFAKAKKAKTVDATKQAELAAKGWAQENGADPAAVVSELTAFLGQKVM